MPNPKYFKPELNTPYEIALRYTTGRMVNGFAGPELRWILMDGRALYTPLEFQAKIEDADIRPGQFFTVEKRVAGKTTEWSVTRVAPSAPQLQGGAKRKQPAVALLERSEALDAPVPPDPPRLPRTQLEDALKTAVTAAAAAEKHGADIGYPVRFKPEDIRALGITVLIGMQSGRAA